MSRKKSRSPSRRPQGTSEPLNKPGRARPKFQPVPLASESATPVWQWLLVGAAAVSFVWSASERTVQTQRPRYSSQQECLQDWNDPRDCEPDSSGGTSGSGSSGGSGGRTWYGPDVDADGRAYHADGRVTDGHKNLRTISFRGSSITRGGFGGGFTRGG